MILRLIKRLEMILKVALLKAGTWWWARSSLWGHENGYAGLGRGEDRRLGVDQVAGEKGGAAMG